MCLADPYISLVPLPLQSWPIPEHQYRYVCERAEKLHRRNARVKFEVKRIGGFFKKDVTIGTVWVWMVIRS